MRLLRLSEVATSPDDRVFASSRTWALVFAFALLGGTVGAVIFGFTMKSSIPYYIAGVLLLFLLLYRGYITAPFRPSNWLVRMTPAGLYIKFRSYLNYRLPDNDPTVVFIPHTEIRSARLIRTRTAVSGPDGRSMQSLRFVELELVGDIVALQKALKAELARPAPQEKHWYGTSSTLYRDYPVSISSPPFLRVRWSARPGDSALLDALRPHTTIAEPVSLSENFASLAVLTREEQEKSLRELDRRGETAAAVYMARRLYGCGLTEATALVEGWRQNKRAGG